MTYPPQHGYPQYPQQQPQYGAYPPPPAGYGPPQAPHYPPPAPVPARKKPRWGLRIGFTAILVGGLFGYFFFIHGGNPERGDCLKDLEETFTGWSIVECGDPGAVYEVVATSRGSYDYDMGTCDGYPDGKAINESAGKRGKRWEMCVVPVGTAK
ncbi:LppU/SCO3897 family protein [Phytomonospora endophytica]|uniref:Uncharacterized protein n=1 Tax=Phytomonospora endophytica TaxID=714109 RepID=A0A841FLN5_9ACTN|nr:hypothetical protein [Phytomonospora endophytica]MBB6036885.1 hypothetical protein [Phytomonospora endophytica]GIG68081.1 hypothetical protein Pen01_43760 [Phytomonospora endophytica]